MNSCTMAMKKSAMIQCQKERMGAPGTVSTPGRTGVRTGGASGCEIKENVPMRRKPKMNAMPIKLRMMLK